MSTTHDNASNDKSHSLKLHLQSLKKKYLCIIMQMSVSKTLVKYTK